MRDAEIFVTFPFTTSDRSNPSRGDGLCCRLLIKSVIGVLASVPQTAMPNPPPLLPENRDREMYFRRLRTLFSSSSMESRIR